jgi:hypothetical protein
VAQCYILNKFLFPTVPIETYLETGIGVTIIVKGRLGHES